MKKITIILGLVFLVFLELTAFSQDKPTTFRLGLGSSIPLSDYGSNDINKDASGLATTGFSLQLQFERIIMDKYFIIATFNNFSNTIDKQVIIADLNKSLPSGSLSTISPEGPSYYSWCFMFGGGLKQQFGKFSFKEHLQIGILKSSSPQMSIYVDNNGKNVSRTTVSSVDAKAFAYNLGAIINFQASQRFSLFAGLDYIGATPEFKNLTSQFTIYPSNQTITSTITSTNTQKQKITVVNIIFGLGFSF